MKNIFHCTSYLYKLERTVNMTTQRTNISYLNTQDNINIGAKIYASSKKQHIMNKQQFHELFEKPIYVNNSLITTIYIIGVDNSLVINSSNPDLSKIINIIEHNNRIEILNKIYNVNHFTVIDIETNEVKQMMCVTNLLTLEHSNFIDDSQLNRLVMQKYEWILNVISEFVNIIVKK